jgi:hypothetical protein
MVYVANSAVKFPTLMLHILCAVISTAFSTKFIIVANRFQMMLETFSIFEFASTKFTFDIDAEFSIAYAILNATTVKAFGLKIQLTNLND